MSFFHLPDIRPTSNKILLSLISKSKSEKKTFTGYLINEEALKSVLISYHIHLVTTD